MSPENTATSAWWDAQDVCFRYLCTETGYTIGSNAFLGDALPINQANLFVFICSGGREQIQNYQVPTPAYTWYSNAVLRGKFTELKDAMDFASLVQQNMPAYKDVDNPGQTGGHCKHRGIPPNVQVFEITDHPEVFSDVVEVEMENGLKKAHHLWIVIINFRVVYNRNKT